MYKIAKIIFNPLIDDKVKEVEKIDSILSMLIKNGQILEECLVEKYDDYYVANVTIVDDDALDEKYYNQYIKDEIKNFEIDIKIICDDALATDSCHCKDHSYYILAINPYDSSSPIICGDCGKEIPLIRVPYIFNEEEHHSILNFQKIYKSVDNLWMNSLSDRFSKRQITDYKSQLNQRGIEICNELEKKIQKPVYYLLCNPIGGWFEFEKNNKELKVCPKCGGELNKLKNSYVEKICEKCRLAFIT